ncbi:MAG: sulfatase [Oceanicoccus sp.]
MNVQFKKGLANIVTLMLLGILANTGFAQAELKPNILLIIIDDLRPMLGVYGNKLINTPNIDQLASDGYVFENAFATVPVCGASRASLLSGRKPTTNRFTTYNSRLDKDLPNAPSIPEHFKNNGYLTLANGKIFDNFTDSVDSWSWPVWSPTGSWTSSIPFDERGEHLQKAYLNNAAGVVGPAFEQLDVPDASYPDGKIADKTIQDLKRLGDSGSAFFLAMGIRKPHLPFNIPQKYWDLYKKEDFTLPVTYMEKAKSTPSYAFHQWGELRQYGGIPAEGPLQDSHALNLIHGYHAAVSYADAQVGKVMRTLKEEGLDKNTVVILIGDHGFHLGEHSMWTKHSLFDLALRSPMIIRDPNRGGGRVTGVTDFLDIFPTLIDMAGLPDIENLDGVSLLPALNNPTVNVKPASLSRWFDGTSVRTQHHRYTEWRSESGKITARMLFDLSNDPNETTNLAEDPQYSELVLKLSEVITQDDSNSPWSPLVRFVVNTRAGT